MKRLLHALFIFNLLANVVTERANCRIINKLQDKKVTLICTGLTNLTVLKEGYSNSTCIMISDSRISNIPGYSFEKFGASLITLDLHGSDIQTISPSAFGKLAKLENLLLWGNKLTTVEYEWFLNMNVYSLKTLDVSFNNIFMINNMVFTMLPNLENFYFDYNKIEVINFQMFDYLRNLKNVKFEKNPWFWGYRAYLTWKFESMKVNYGKDWDEWEWMNAAIKECSQNGYGVIPQDTVLDCIVENLLNYTYELFSTEQQDTKCIREAQQLVRCMRPKNITGNTDNETTRRILEDYTAILPTMFRSNVLFVSPCHPIITIHRLEGPRLEIPISHSETVGYLKQMISKLLDERDQNWKPEKMRLWLRGLYMEDNHMISDYKLSSKDRITLLLNNR